MPTEDGVPADEGASSSCPEPAWTSRSKIAATIAMAGLIMAFFPVWPGALVGAGILGIGFGAYLAVDFALLTQVLPQAADRGKDMGVINVANSLPQVFAPLIAFISLQYLGGYVTLFTTAAVIGLLGAVFVVKIKGVD